MTFRNRFGFVGWDPASTDGQYTFVYGAAGMVPNGTMGGKVINETTGAVTPVPPPPNCGPSWEGPVSGGSSFLFECSTLEVYTLPTGPWRSLELAPQMQYCEGVPEPNGCDLTAVGSDWVQYNDYCYHCGISYLFENLQTGEEQSSPDQPGTPYGSSLIDLSSPSLSQTVCAPLATLPATKLLIAGRFAVSQTFSSLHLERCGTKLYRYLGPNFKAVAIGRSVVIWLVYINQKPVLHGLFLPNGRRFVANLPPGVSDAGDIAVTPEHLYVYGSRRGGYGRLWAEPLPTLPKQPRNG